MGVISPPQASDGQAVTAAKINDPVNTIANEFNGNIDDNNIKSGAAINGSKMASNTTIALKPQLAYAFRVSMNAAASTGNGAFAATPFDTEQFDVGSNVAAGVFTAPVTGNYQFNWNEVATLSAGADETFMASLFVNGSEYSRGSEISYRNLQGSHGSDLVHVTAGQTVDIRSFAPTSRSLSVGNSTNNYFSGYLVSV